MFMLLIVSKGVKLLMHFSKMTAQDLFTTGLESRPPASSTKVLSTTGSNFISFIF